ncbi:methionyl aminopeptidase [Deltaproteobacteria bacterium TL4]
MKTLSRNDSCWCESGKKYKRCHLKHDSLNSAHAKPAASKRTIIKTEEQIEGIRKSCQLTKRTLDMLEDRIRPGITTNDINEWVHDYTLQNNAIPAPLNYRNFPKSVCTSLNHVVCHGIPDDTVLKEGDILNVDVTPILNGYYGDASRMYIVGETTDEAVKLINVTKECLDLGIQQVRPYGTVGDIGAVIQNHAESHGYSVVRDFAGHGTGIEFHEEPQVLHYGKKNTGTILLPNMIFTIEPMINLGRYECRILADGWTAVTVDNSLSAQWEHTVLVTKTGFEILTI